MSVAIGRFSMTATVDGELIELQKFSDVEKLPIEKAMRILEHLLFVERPALLLQVSDIPHLQETIRSLTEEKDYFFKKAQIIENLSGTIVQYHNENELLKQEIKVLKDSIAEVSDKLAGVTARLDGVIQLISASQMAMDADNAAVKFIFPEGRQKPYCLRSYSNLLSFLSKPESDEFSGPHAPAAWLGLTEDKRAEVLARADQFTKKYPYLKVSIKTLKEGDDWKQAHSTTTVDETMKFYKNQGDDEACDAIFDCATFLGLPFANDEVTEVDSA